MFEDYEDVNVDAERAELEAEARAEVADEIAAERARWEREYRAAEAAAKAEREAVYGPGNVWTTDEVQRDFSVVSFLAPFVSVVRKSDGQAGYLLFDHSPRVYYDFTPRR